MHGDIQCIAPSLRLRRSIGAPFAALQSCSIARAHVRDRARVRARVSVRVRACVRVCVRACVRGSVFGCCFVCLFVRSVPSPAQLLPIEEVEPPVPAQSRVSPGADVGGGEPRS